VNDPYKGVELVRRHGRPAERRHSLQIEIKRTLYMDEVTLEPNAGYVRLERDLAQLMAVLAEFVTDRAAS
jgi:N-formylglutamate deformylase